MHLTELTLVVVKLTNKPPTIIPCQPLRLYGKAWNIVFLSTENTFPYCTVGSVYYKYCGYICFMFL